MRSSRPPVEAPAARQSQPFSHASETSRRRVRLRRPAGVLAVLALAVAPVGVTTAWADDRSDAADEQTDAEQRRAELTASLEGVSAELGQAYIDLQNADASLTTAQDDLTAADSALAEKEREQQQASDRLDVAESDLVAIGAQATDSQADATENTTSVADLVVVLRPGLRRRR